MIIGNNFLEIGGRRVPYFIQPSGKSGFRIRVTGEGLLMKAPYGILGATEKSFLVKKSAWILKHYIRLVEQQGVSFKFNATIESETLVFGKPASISVLKAPDFRFRFIGEEHKLIITKPESYKGADKLVIGAALKGLGKIYLNKRVNFWIETTQSRVNRIRIKHVESLWGSCSTLGNVNLNWHLIMLDKQLIDYVIVHELMHLRQMNHSSAFWKEVAKYYPGYQEADKKLNQFTWVIGIYK